MPRAKITTKKTASPKTPKKDEEALVDFEQFLAQSPTKSRNNNKNWLFITLLVIIVILGGAFVYLSKNTKVEKDSGFKAVYIDNGDNDQVYYAKVVREDAHYIYLDDVYYIEVFQQVVPSEDEDAEPQVVPVRSLVPRNTDGYTQVNRDKVIVIEEVSPDSEVMKEINRIESETQQ